MNKSIETRIVTAALPFANNIPHLGNIGGSHLPADIFARFSRLIGKETVFIGGTDEHGTAIEFAAQQQDTTPKELADKLYLEHKAIYEWFQISYDNFSRTSREIHHSEVHRFFHSLYKAKLITEGTLSTPFCSDCSKGLADRYIYGTCPHCSYESANGDQCEQCGTTLESTELKIPHCAFCNQINVTFKESRHLFLDLNQVITKVEEWLRSNTAIRKQVRNLALGWIKKGLRPRCITRDLKWGIPVPLDGYRDKVFYVWFENVIGYLSATVELLGEEAHSLWSDESTKTYYFLGKDNIPFHTIYWPGELLGDKNYVLPHNVVGLQYLTYEGKKFSKSKGYGIFADQAIASDIPSDYWRFYLTWIIPETSDTNFSLTDFEERINKELIGNYGNLIHRTVSLINQKCAGKLQVPRRRDTDLEAKIAEHVDKIVRHYDACEIRSALHETLALSDCGNGYLSTKQPWKTNDPDSLFYAAEIGRIAALLLSPVIPTSCEQILQCYGEASESLRVTFVEREFAEVEPVFTRLERLHEKL